MWRTTSGSRRSRRTSIARSGRRASRAERHPRTVLRIVEGGHELASHGFAHRRASEQDEPAFLEDIARTKALLEDLGGVRVRGYRAPSFSIGPQEEWAFDCLERAGNDYSSSVYPIRHDHYGAPGAPRFPHRVGGELIEAPVATARMLGRNWPAAGGGYFRLMPYPLSRRLLRRINAIDRRPAVFYFHPWELDPAQPRVDGVGARTRFRHYRNLPRVEERLRRLLRDFRWGRLDRLVDAAAGEAPLSAGRRGS